MRSIIEFLPVIVFFAAYKLHTLAPEPVVESINAAMPFGFTAGNQADAIDFAALIAIAVSGLAVLIHFIKHRDYGKNQTITSVLFIAGKTQE